MAPFCSMLSLPVPPPGQRTRVGGLVGSSDALALAGLAASAKPLAVFTASAGDGQRLVHEIAFFAPELRVHLLPDWETLPYDSFSPHQDLVSERLATLYQISHQACDVIVVPVTTALYRLPPVEFLAGLQLLPQAGRDDLARRRCASSSSLAGYQHVTQVVSPGEFSFRGGLIDLFPMGSALPYRIDLFDNEIDSIRTFDVDTQRSHLQGQGRAAAAGARVPHRRGRPHALSPELPREVRGRSVPQPALQGREQRRVRRRASSTTCRCSSSRPRRSPTICREGTLVCLHGDLHGGDRALLARHPLALRAAARRPRPPAAAAAPSCS